MNSHFSKFLVLGDWTIPSDCMVIVFLLLHSFHILFKQIDGIFHFSVFSKCIIDTYYILTCFFWVISFSVRFFHVNLRHLSPCYPAWIVSKWAVLHYVFVHVSLSLSLFFFFGCIGFSLLCARAFSSCFTQGLLFVAAQASHCGGFSCCGAWALGAQASIVAAHGLSSCGTQALEHAGFSSCSAWAQ